MTENILIYIVVNLFVGVFYAAVLVGRKDKFTALIQTISLAILGIPLALLHWIANRKG